MGVNESDLDPSIHTVVSNGSCTANCLAPIVKVIDEHFGIERGVMTAIHVTRTINGFLTCPAVCAVPGSSYVDGADQHRGSKAISLVLPHLAGKLDGISVRVPTPNLVAG